MKRQWWGFWQVLIVLWSVCTAGGCLAFVLKDTQGVLPLAFSHAAAASTRHHPLDPFTPDFLPAYDDFLEEDAVAAGDDDVDDDEEEDDLEIDPQIELDASRFLPGTLLFDGYSIRQPASYRQSVKLDIRKKRPRSFMGLDNFDYISSTLDAHGPVSGGTSSHLVSEARQPPVNQQQQQQLQQQQQERPSILSQSRLQGHRQRERPPSFSIDRTRTRPHKSRPMGGGGGLPALSVDMNTARLQKLLRMRNNYETAGR